MFYHARSGLYLTHYRAYDPHLGRWLSRDPMGESGGINLYAYVGGNPVSSIDPTGLLCFDFDQFADEIEKNRFDLGATAATLGTTLGIGTMPKTPSELRGFGPRSQLNPYTSQLSRNSTRLGRRALREFGRTTAGVALSTTVTAALVFEGFYDLSVIGQAAINATSSEDDCGCK